MTTLTPKQIVLATLNNGPNVYSRLVGAVGHHCALSAEWAAVATANAIVELVIAKEIVQFHDSPPAYRITVGVDQMEDDSEPDERRVTTRKIAKPVSAFQRLVDEAKDREAQGKRERGEA